MTLHICALPQETQKTTPERERRMQRLKQTIHELTEEGLDRVIAFLEYELGQDNSENEGAR